MPTSGTAPIAISRWAARAIPTTALRTTNFETVDALLRQFRPVIETVHSQLEKMGVQRLHARTNLGLFLKLYASLLALLLNSFV